MSLRRSSSAKMVAKNKNKVIPCSTPEQVESPSRDSDSVCDSDAASPVPFLCTQDGAEGETDVVWNFYTPKSEHAASSRLKNSTPLCRKSRKPVKHKLIEKQIPRRRPVRPSQKKTELFQELIELNQDLHDLISKKPEKACTPENHTSRLDEDIFNESIDLPKDSPKSGIKNNTRCLRRNVLSSKFTKPDLDNALESDDSMNECLLKASQAVENILESEPTPPKRVCYDTRNTGMAISKPDFSFKINEDSIDAILNSIKIESPAVSKIKKIESPGMNNDSFDNLVGNLNDSVIEQLTQMPIKTDITNRRGKCRENSDWKVQEVIVHDGSPTGFGRHNSMPESPVINHNKPSTSGMAFGRYNSMPYGNNTVKHTEPGDSPIRCSPDQIERKRQQAREKLFAKRLLPFTSSQNSSQLLQPSQPPSRKALFQPKVASKAAQNISHVEQNNKSTKLNNNVTNQTLSSSTDIKLLIEKKRQEALMKLRRRQPQSK